MYILWKADSSHCGNILKTNCSHSFSTPHPTPTLSSSPPHHPPLPPHPPPQDNKVPELYFTLCLDSIWTEMIPGNCAFTEIIPLTLQWFCHSLQTFSCKKKLPQSAQSQDENQPRKDLGTGTESVKYHKSSVRTQKCKFLAPELFQHTFRLWKTLAWWANIAVHGLKFKCITWVDEELNQGRMTSHFLRGVVTLGWVGWGERWVCGVGCRQSQPLYSNYHKD